MQGELKEKASDTRFVFRPVRERKTDTDWTVFAENAPSSLYLSYRFDRGFTGHEHYADLKIINMKAPGEREQKQACLIFVEREVLRDEVSTYGRLYDPVIARFFSPDNFVQTPDFTQSYNRYSYCLNNPLQYVDPSGESFLAAAFAIGALTNVFFQMISGNINSAGDFLFYAGIGGFAGMAGAAAGSAAASAVGVGGFLGGAASGAASGAVGGFIAGTGNALVGGNDFATALGYGWLGGVGGALFGGLSGGLASGITDAIHGNNFWDGSFVEEFATGGSVTEGDYIEFARRYNNSPISEQYDIQLNDRVSNTFGVKVCDYNIEEITTKTSDFGTNSRIYGLNAECQFVNTEKNYLVGGYVTGNSVSGTHVHVSPSNTVQNDVIFRAVAGHELTHAYHRYLVATWGLNWNHVFSDRAAYHYSFNVYICNGYIYRAMSTMVDALNINYWGWYPGIYTSPFF